MMRDRCPTRGRSDLSPVTAHRRGHHPLTPSQIELAEAMRDEGRDWPEIAAALDGCTEGDVRAALNRLRNPNPNSGRVMIGIHDHQLPPFLAFASDPQEPRHQTFDTVTRLAKIGAAALAGGFQVQVA